MSKSLGRCTHRDTIFGPKDPPSAYYLKAKIVRCRAQAVGTREWVCGCGEVHNMMHYCQKHLDEWDQRVAKYPDKLREGLEVLPSVFQWTRDDTGELDSGKTP